MSLRIYPMKLSFCPKCETLMTTQKEDDQVYQMCSTCEYKEVMNECHMIRSTELKTQRTGTTLPFAMIYDDAVQRSTKVMCSFVDCPSHDPSRWGELTERNIRIQPDVMVTNYTDPDRVSTYVCRICGTVFRP